MRETVNGFGDRIERIDLSHTAISVQSVEEKSAGEMRETVNGFGDRIERIDLSPTAISVQSVPEIR
jgi:hypothetical protein